MGELFDPRNPNSLNAIRLLLASLVVLSHCWPLTIRGGGGEPMVWATRGQSTLGGFAVMSFFIISGFLISASWDRRKSGLDYLLKRIKRIHPAYIVASISGFLIFGALTTNDPNYWSTFGPLGLIKYAVLLKSYDPSGAFPDNPFPGVVNGSLWTIRYEFWCYLLVAFLGLIRLLTVRWFTLVLVGAGVVSSALNPGMADFWHDLPTFVGGKWPPLILAFVCGIAFYAWHKSVPWSKPVFWVCLAGFFLSFIGGYDVVAPLCLTYILMFVGFTPSPVNNWFKTFDISYGVYLYAFPLQQTIVHYLKVREPLLLFALAMPPILCAGVLSWLLVERPFLRSRGRRIPGERSSSASTDSAPLTTPPAAPCVESTPEGA